MVGDPTLIPVGRNRRHRAIAALLLIALATVLPVVGSASTRSQLLYASGLIPFASEDWEASYQLFDQAVRADPSDALATYYRGLTAARLGLWNVALDDIRSALELRPGLPRASLDLGIIYFEMKQYEEAEKWFERASRQACCQYSGLLFRGLTRYRLGDDAGALEYLTQAEEDPKLRPTARYYMALTLLRQGQWEKGRADLERLSAESPESELGKIAAKYLKEAGSGLRRPGAESAGPAWTFRGETGLEYDSNVMLAPDDDDVKSSRGISGEEDGRFRLGLGGSYRLVDNETLSATMAYDFYQSVHFDLTEFDLQGHSVRMNVSSPWLGVRVGATAVYDFYALNYRSFFQQGSATPWVSFFEGKRTATRLLYTLRGRDYFRDPFEPYLDSIKHSVGLRQVYVRQGDRGVLAGGYRFDYQDPASGDGEEFEFLGHQLDVTYSCPLFHWADMSIGYLLRLEDYEYVNSRTGTKQFPDGTRRRHDHRHEFVLHLERDVSEHWVIGLSYIGVLNGSNISEFDYARHIVSTGLRYRF